MKKLVIALAFSLASPFLYGVPLTPSSEAINSVYMYYTEGTSAILSETKLCQAIEDLPPHRFECKGEIQPTEEPLPLYSEAYYWISLLIPLQHDIRIEFRFFLHGELMRKTSLDVAPSLRYRLWKYLPSNVPGNWRIEVWQINSMDQETRLKEDSYQVR